jgi:hypothetical protein
MFSVADQEAFSIRWAIARGLDADPLVGASRSTVLAVNSVRASLESKAAEAEADESGSACARHRAATELRNWTNCGSGRAAGDLRNRLVTMAEWLEEEIPGSSRSNVGELMRRIERRVATLYRLAAKGLLPRGLPDVEHEAVITDLATGFLRQFRVDAWTEIGPQGFESRVTLRFKRCSLSPDMIAQVPYILFHEVACHAFQSAWLPDRANVDQTCPWTEGWMDTLAFEAAKLWSRPSPRADEWLAFTGKRAIDAMGEYHRNRYKVHDNLLQPRAWDLEAASLAFDRLVELLRGRSRSARYAVFRIVKFSVYANLLITNSGEREQLGLLLGSLLGERRLSKASGLRASKAARETQEFLIHQNPGRLISGLGTVLQE